MHIAPRLPAAARCFRLLGIFLAAWAGGAAQAATPDQGADGVSVDSRIGRAATAEVAVVVLSNAAGRPFDAAVDRHLLLPLAANLRAVPMAKVRAGVVAIHGTAATLHLPATLLALGRRLKVPYVMVVEAVGRPRASHVFVGLVDVQRGKTMLAHREAVRGGTLDAQSGRSLASQVVDSLGVHLARGHKEEAHHGAPPAERPAAKADDEPVKGHHAAAAEAAKVDEPKHLEPTHKRPHPAATDHGPGRSPADQPMVHALMPRARLGAGLELMQRLARIKPPSQNGVTAPCYCSSGKSAQPLFPALTLSGEITSGLLTKERRSWLGGFGLRLDFTLAPVKTVVFKQDGSKTNIKSLAYLLDASLFYRLPWFAKARLSPDVKIGLGLHKFAFPLKGSQFTGVDYVAPDLQLAIDVPFIAQLGAFAAVDVRPVLKAGKDASAVLGKPRAGFGFGGRAGLRGGIGQLAFDLSVHIDRYQVPYSGTTNFANMPTGADGQPVQFSNVKLTDQVLGIMVRGNWAL